ncbi:hypothetical protein [Picosynechococcus sp. PCC 73109]|uniref:hypothetical protein n=1 Tax=Picosynechococcus sp. PCC 73109 TaxID=374982 RepID=UPI000745940A|nr:hypothetical protein [Picosynechococcus sp. PCC 73109]AMA10801.1 hypothetical protein AWQ23_15290 [Picosynechococcus sp. PCC 73109]
MVSPQLSNNAMLNRQRSIAQTSLKIFADAGSAICTFNLKAGMSLKSGNSHGPCKKTLETSALTTIRMTMGQEYDKKYISSPSSSKMDVNF